MKLLLDGVGGGRVQGGTPDEAALSRSYNELAQVKL
jgi:hypothetical protein